MKNKKIKIISFGLALILVFFVVYKLSTKESEPEKGGEVQKVDFKQIKNRGILKAGVSTNSTDYFIYRGKAMGFQYELLKNLTKRYDLELELVVENDLIKSIEYLKNRDLDVIAQSLTITNERKKIFSFTYPIAQTRQVLVQRKESYNDDSTEFIRNQLDLGGKTIHIQKGSAAHDRLLNLSEEIADSINIVENDSLEMENLISLVANKKIDYMVCDENVALINRSFYNNIDVKTPVSFPQNLAWGIRNESTDLKDSIDKWLERFKSTNDYKFLYHKYFKSRRAPRTRSSPFYSGHEGRISQYDKYIKEASDIINWDWRLLASLIYQESRFNTDAVSWAGAFGIMQLMPSTAEFLGVNKNSSVKKQIMAGAKYIKYLEKNLPVEISDKNEKIKLILASYNIGPGHINDAIRLAKKYGRNPRKWEGNVKYFLLNKSNPDVFRDEVVKHGYCSGVQPVKYVDEIFERYRHYKNLISLS